MPQFRFRCTRCDHEFSEMLWPTEPISAVRCPECGAGDAEKQLAPFAVRSSSRAAPRSDEPPFCGRCGQNRPPCGE